VPFTGVKDQTHYLVPEALCEQAKAEAGERHESISDVVREALGRYVTADDDAGPP